MNESLTAQVLPFAAFLAERLELERVALIGDDLTFEPRATGIAVSAFGPAHAGEVGRDCLPVFVAPRNHDRSVSATGEALLDTRHRHRLALVACPPLDDPSTNDADNLASWLGLFGVCAPIVGHLPEVNGSPTGTIALVEDPNRPLSPIDQPPDDFTVVAFMPVYNEIDILGPSIDDLNRQGIRAYILDNWSTDGSFELASTRLGHGVVGIERTPIDGPRAAYDFRAILARIEELASSVPADWFIKSDVDEARRSPWNGRRLREAIYQVDMAGYNRIDFTVANFKPTDNSYEAGTNFVAYFKHFDWGHNPGHFVQQKAWMNSGQAVSIAEHAGHLVTFDGARTYPYKFLLRHYPIRSQQHGERKIFQDRKPRISIKDRKKGWHTHYDRYDPETRFIVDVSEVMPYDDDFRARYLVERLSGIGIDRLAPLPRPDS